MTNLEITIFNEWTHEEVEDQEFFANYDFSDWEDGEIISLENYEGSDIEEHLAVQFVEFDGETGQVFVKPIENEDAKWCDRFGLVNVNELS